MTYGQSVTDACIGWDDTLDVLRWMSNSVAERRDRAAETARASLSSGEHQPAFPEQR
jgi:3-deoxy-7-phosphoheptulonate synthase